MVPVGSLNISGYSVWRFSTSTDYADFTGTYDYHLLHLKKCVTRSCCRLVAVSDYSALKSISWIIESIFVCWIHVSCLLNSCFSWYACYIVYIFQKWLVYSLKSFLINVIWVSHVAFLFYWMQLVFGQRGSIYLYHHESILSGIAWHDSFHMIHNGSICKIFLNRRKSNGFHNLIFEISSAEMHLIPISHLGVFS